MKEETPETFPFQSKLVFQPKTMERDSTQRPRVLLAGDPAEDASVGMALRDLGYEVDFMMTVIDAVRVGNDNDYVLVVLGRRLQKRDTIALIRESLAGGGEDSGQKQILIVGLADPAREPGEPEPLLDGHLEMPVTPESVTELLENWPDNARQATRSETGEPPRSEEDLDDPIDEEALQQLGSIHESGSDRFLQRMIRIYLKSSADLLKKLETAVDAGDAKQVFEVAHSLKSTSATIGARGLSDLALTLEVMGRTDDLTRAGELYGSIQVQFRRVREALERRIDTV